MTAIETDKSDRCSVESQFRSQRLIFQEGFESRSVTELFNLNDKGFYQDLYTFGDLQNEGHINMTVCWYSSNPKPRNADPAWAWPSGKLYDAPYERSLHGKACSIWAQWSDTDTTTRDQNWICRVQTASRDLVFDDIERLVREPLLALPLTICLVTSMVLKRVMEEWDSLLRYMESMVNVHNEIVDPDRHDRLLFDDEQFSRSRRYFWMLSSLSAYKQMLEETRLNCERLFELVNRVYPDRAVLAGKELKVLEALDPQMVRLNRTMKRASLLHSRVLALRDGLFNASAVLESRAANRLSENVRLLTYVSIFYLPLSFCTSLWSTTNTFSWTGLMLAMCLTAIATYLVTFNLNQIVRLLSEVYSTFRSRIIDHMADHVNIDTSDNGVSSETSSNLPGSRREWIAIAARFRQFKPPKLQPQPSEWLILRYIIETTAQMVWDLTPRKVFNAIRWSYRRRNTKWTGRPMSNDAQQEDNNSDNDGTFEQEDPWMFDMSRSDVGAGASDRSTDAASRSTASVHMSEPHSGPETDNGIGEDLPTPSLLHRRHVKEQDLEAGVAARASAEVTASD
ncbi:hypothetical protein AUEXF2481DRAFT_8551 [Aureobasidium subglaciale EXF-2481]|uniref:Uncharacterized protein n=1 Tax=Aureobasidium subglaciale (strain EXF-2481) TaxID=1043005 RepID=A0A074Y172_AURSE|nr:uncharacterized protein AUEXF2481DRAFT_8551 [Aureobasidium subglaciale EXF-2481]KAI5202954.1 hypothetical protein E4T38_05314 [Aureobasidium subglaciale]KAI5221766.1 hypothetical protein E4T40_05247 [Aureobasidium subglaciale]KAI5225835.1 hypothetical protein E4T41_05066 [Aureobasidium subglaciale]KAI5261597.1 hypothetical protein E4T46_04959 [Aureobasidium subglaciale]KEQ91490.1 hypothetical protein AUEXF2481DRAFT_8551 [Aureobasidium subglaciale EXF-2481]